MKSEKFGLRFNMGNITSSIFFDRDNAVERLSKLTGISVLFWGTHPATGLPLALAAVSQYRRLPMISSSQILSKFISCSGMRLWTHLGYAISVLRCFSLPGKFCKMWAVSQHLMLLVSGNRYSKLAHDISEAANFATYFTASQRWIDYVNHLALWY